MSNSDHPVQLEPYPLGEPVADLNASPPLQRTPIHGQGISLFPLDPQRDAAELYEISHGSFAKESIWTYLGYGPFKDLSAMETWLEERSQSTDPLFFTVTDRENSRRAGLVSFLSIDLPSRRLELGHIWYTPNHQRGRTNTETIYLMLNEAFDRLNCRRVEWKCNACNVRSRNAAERLGFRFEGVFRQHLIVKGRNRDTAWYSLLDHEWPTVKRAMETWLDWNEGSPPGLATLRNADAGLGNQIR